MPSTSIQYLQFSLTSFHDMKVFLSTIRLISLFDISKVTLNALSNVIFKISIEHRQIKFRSIDTYFWDNL